MKIRNKIISFILSVIILCSLAASVSACGRSRDSASFKIYFANASYDDIQSIDYTITDSGMDDMYTMVTELFDQMFTRDYTADQLFSAKPENVNIISYSINDRGVLTVDFEDSYLNMTNVQEIILRAAVVLTVIQINGLNGVVFTVENDPITYSDGTAIGTMTADDFVNILLTETGMLRQETDVTLYYTNAQGTSLVPVISHFVTSNNNTSMEEYIVTQLLGGPPAESGAYPTIASGVELISVVSSDRICYVNFGESFLEQDFQPVSDEILIYSIVNSLCRLTYVDYVQFLIDGETADKLHTVTDISMPFTRNRSLELSY